RVVENDGPVGAGVGDPIGELLAGGGGTGGIVGVAQVDEIDPALGNRGDEIILRRAGQVDQSGVGALFIGLTGIPGHHVGVDVDRIDRIGDRDDIVTSENIEDIAGVALGTVGDEHLVGGDAETGIL